MIALITGITGQDGHHLTPLLLKQGYEVIGLVRDIESETTRFFRSRFPFIKLFEGCLSDYESLYSVIKHVSPNEIYNLGGISDVRESYEIPVLTADITGLGLLRILEAIRNLGWSKKIRIYQSSSSEIFGISSESPQNENTSLSPVSPYGHAKSFAHRVAQQYRQDYGMFINSGILYNHEGEYRRHSYVTRKISSNVAKLKLGKIENFKLGNIEARRDWGYAGDYVDAIWRMMRMEQSSEYIVATGVTHSVREFILEALCAAELEPNIEKYVSFDSKYLRYSSERTLVGNPTKAQDLLGWSATTSFKDLVSLMVKHDLNLESHS